MTTIKLQDDFFAPRIETAQAVTIPAVLEQCYKTGRIDAFDLNWKAGNPNIPHQFFDSDVAKLIEGMAHMLKIKEDATMSAELDKIIDKIISAQQPDGYLNSYYTQMAPEKRFSDLFNGHELYCAGHLMEAAVAHYYSTGKRKFLDAMLKYAEYLYKVFGPEGERRGCPGHEEIELALVKLYQASGNENCLKLAVQFLNVRGVEPNSFGFENINDDVNLKNRQAHIPVRSQTTADGHAVRALYLYSGMAAVGSITEDKTLLDAVKKIFNNLQNCRLYLSGGIGSSAAGEAFTIDYDLTNTASYAESCAAVALAQLCRTMLKLDDNSNYADIMEQVLYNGALSGISLSGDKFFYANLLESTEATYEHGWVARERREWFGCSCCPTTFARFLPQLQDFCAETYEDVVQINIPAAAEITFASGKIVVSGQYPYQGDIHFDIQASGKFTLKIRIPNWCRNWDLKLNDKDYNVQPEHGMAKITREWNYGDSIELKLAMSVRLVRANALVAASDGQGAIMRGPLLYCCESCDNLDWQTGNGGLKNNLDAKLVSAPEGLPASTVAIDVAGFKLERKNNTDLYSDEEVIYHPTRLRFIPYALWQNRGLGSMKVYHPVIL